MRVSAGMNRPQDSGLLARGVHRLPFLSGDGLPLLAAIDGQHRRRFEREVWPGEDVRAVAGVLARMLDLADPHQSSGGSTRS